MYNRSKAGFGDWFKEQQAQASGPSPTKDAPSGLSALWGASAPAADPESGDGDAAASSALPSFLGRFGVGATATTPADTEWTCGLSRCVWFSRRLPPARIHRPVLVGGVGFPCRVGHARWPCCLCFVAPGRVREQHVWSVSV